MMEYSQSSRGSENIRDVDTYVVLSYVFLVYRMVLDRIINCKTPKYLYHSYLMNSTFKHQYLFIKHLFSLPTDDF